MDVQSHGKNEGKFKKYQSTAKEVCISEKKNIDFFFYMYKVS